jgi:hypothetical protein
MPTNPTAAAAAAAGSDIAGEKCGTNGRPFYPDFSRIHNSALLSAFYARFSFSHLAVGPVCSGPKYPSAGRSNPEGSE